MHAKQKGYKDVFLPRASTVLVFLGLTILLTVYFFISHYSTRFITQQGITAFDGSENNWLVHFIFYIPWASWFDRALDFAFWGALASIILIIAWSLSAGKTTVENHRLVEGFENFRESKNQWRQNFIVAVVLKVALLFTSLYLVSLVLFKLIPTLSLAVAVVLAETNATDIVDVAMRAVFLFVALCGIATCVKVFRHVNVA